MVLEAKAATRARNLRQQQGFAKKRVPKIGNFQINDFVLVAKNHGMSKIFRWQGPYKVVDKLHHRLYVVQDLITLQKYELMDNYLRLYQDQKLNICTKVLNQIAHDTDGFLVESILAHRKIKLIWHLNIKWRGLPMGDYWEPLHCIAQDVPALVKRYINKLTNLDIRNELRNNIRTTRQRKKHTNSK